MSRLVIVVMFVALAAISAAASAQVTVRHAGAPGKRPVFDVGDTIEVAVKAMTEWARAGGVLVIDKWAGLFDEHGRGRSKPAPAELTAGKAAQSTEAYDVFARGKGKVVRLKPSPSRSRSSSTARPRSTTSAPASTWARPPPRPHYCRNLETAAGRAEMTLPLALNDAAGKHSACPRRPNRKDRRLGNAPRRHLTAERTPYSMYAKGV